MLYFWCYINKTNTRDTISSIIACHCTPLPQTQSHAYPHANTSSAGCITGWSAFIPCICHFVIHMTKGFIRNLRYCGALYSEKWAKRAISVPFMSKLTMLSYIILLFTANREFVVKWIVFRTWDNKVLGSIPPLINYKCSVGKSSHSMLPHWHSGDDQSVGSSVRVVSRWLWPGNRTFSELDSMVVTWPIVVFVRSDDAKRSWISATRSTINNRLLTCVLYVCILKRNLAPLVQTIIVSDDYI